MSPGPSWSNLVKLKPVAAVLAGLALVMTGLVPMQAPAAEAAPAVPNLDAKEEIESFVVTYKTGTPDAAAIEQHAGTSNALEVLPEETKTLLADVASKQGAKVEEATAHEGAMSAVYLDAPINGDKAEQFMTELLKDDAVEKVEPNITMRTKAAVVNDSYYGQQWSLAATAAGINVEGAWAQATGAGVTIAVLDSGIIKTHPDLDGKLVGGYDFISQSLRARDGNGRDNDPSDEGDWANAGECGTNDPQYDEPSSWHGTHVSGIAAAETNNAQGLAGVARDASLLEVRVLGKCGGTALDIADGIKWAAGLPIANTPANTHPAKVINMSLGGDSAYCPAFYQQAIDAAVAAGSIVVVAAGNESMDAAGSTPANCNNVITVGASGEAAGQSWFSNFGAVVDVTAPGGDDTQGQGRMILSAVDRGQLTPVGPGYAYMEGTSQATPHVAGVVAMMAQLKPDIATAQALQYLRSTAKPMTSCNGGCGAGIIDANAALTALRRDLGTSPTPSPTPTLTGSPAPAAQPGMAVSDMNPYLDQAIDLQAWGFQASESVTVVVDGWDYSLGSVNADGQGRMSAWWRVGYDMPRGYHTLYVVGNTSGNYASHWILVR